MRSQGVRGTLPAARQLILPCNIRVNRDHDPELVCTGGCIGANEACSNQSVRIEGVKFVKYEAILPCAAGSKPLALAAPPLAPAAGHCSSRLRPSCNEHDLDRWSIHVAQHPNGI